MYREGRTADALFHWKMSLEMYVPFSPTPGVAAGRLLSAAERFRKEGDEDMAARAFGYLRSGLLATRHLRQPMPELLAKAEEELGRMLPAGPASDAGDRAPPGGTNIVGTALLALGFLAWPVSVFRMIRGWRDSGKAFTPRFVIPAAGSLLLLAAGAILA